MKLLSTVNIDLRCTLFHFLKFRRATVTLIVLVKSRSVFSISYKIWKMKTRSRRKASFYWDIKTKDDPLYELVAEKEIKFYHESFQFPNRQE